MFKQSGDFAPSETLVRCPFNSSHQLIAAKLVFHINKCKDRQKVAHLFKVCPYNKIHWIKRSQFKKHLNICKNKIDQKQEQVPEIESDEEKRAQTINAKRVWIENKNIDQEKQIQNDSNDSITLSDCQQCQSIMKSPIFNELMKSSKKLKKYMNLYNQLNSNVENLTRMKQKDK